MEYDVSLTLCVAGDPGVGKTQIINRYTRDTFDDRYTRDAFDDKYYFWYIGMFIYVPQGFK